MTEKNKKRKKSEPPDKGIKKKKKTKPGAKEDIHVKSAWEIAQERAEAMLNKTDEEIKKQDQEKEAEAAESAFEPEQTIADETAEYIEALQRLQAEFANYRKRVEKEKAQMAEFAAAGLISELTDVLDDFERGMDDEHTRGVPEDFLAGMTGVQRKLTEILSRKGLERIKTVGEQFNPEIHEAVGQQPTDEIEPGTITGEIRPGYLLGDRLLRAPMVQVAVANASSED